MNTVKSEVFSVKVIKREVVKADQPLHDHWLPFTNLDLLVPPIDVGSFVCYKKSQDQTVNDDVSIMVDALKTSLSQTLVSFYPFAGEIVHNAAGEPEIHCNNRGVDFIQAAANVDLRDLNVYDPDESMEGKLMPTKHHTLLAIQITTLKCGGMVIACMFDHRVADGYSALMFVSNWADMNRSIQPSYFPSFRRSILNHRRPTLYSTSIANMYLPISDHLSSLRLQIDPKSESAELDQLDSQLISRIYYMEGEELKRLQSLASENKGQRSKLESFTSFLWKITASFLEESGHLGHMCKMAVAVDGRRRLSEGEGVEKQKLMAAHFGNVLSIPFREIQSKDLKDMPLSVVANEVHDLLKSAATKDHFLELIDWVEDQRPKALISRSFTTMKKGVSIMVSSGQGLSIMGNTDFGWGKPVFGSCHLPSARTDCYVMTMESPINNDWVVYMHLPTKLLHYMETRAGHVFKPLTADYLKLST